MDKHFLEFWGNYLIAVARGQSQLEDFARWMGRGFEEVDKLTEQFKKIYGLEKLDPKDPSYAQTWKTASEAFRHSFKEFFEQAGWVPKSDYTTLEKENRALKDKVSELESAVSRLKDLLNGSGADQGSALKVFQDLVNKQGEEFQKLMKKLSDDTKEPL